MESSESRLRWAITAGVAVAGALVLAEFVRRSLNRRREIAALSGDSADRGAFVERIIVAPAPQPPPPAARLPLSGLSFAVSDNFDIKGYITGFGIPDWKQTHEPAEQTAVVVATMLRNGAACVGRTVMDELGLGLLGENIHYGTPENPVMPSQVPGGSCSGAAVAVSAGLVEFALGTDTRGDIGIPASFCGILGFRPSHGTVSAVGILPNAKSLDSVGFLARDPAVLKAVGYALFPAYSPTGNKSKHLIFADDCFQLLHASQKVISSVKSATEGLYGYQDAQHISLGHYISSCIPSLNKFLEPSPKVQMGTFSLKALSTVMLMLQSYEFKTNHEEWINSVKPKMSTGTADHLKKASNFGDENIKSLYDVRLEVRTALNDLLKDGGILVIPTTADCPVKRQKKQKLSAEFEDRLLILSSIAAVSGCSQVTVPLGLHGNQSLSISFIASYGSDRFLLDTIVDLYPVIREKFSVVANSPSLPDANVDIDASELLKEKGNAAFKVRQWSKAISFYSEAIKLNGSNATYYSNRAAAYLELGRFQQAESDCCQAILLDKKNVKAYLRRGASRESLLRYKEALQDFRHALALEPQNKAALAAEKRLQKLLR